MILVHFCRLLSGCMAAPRTPVWPHARERTALPFRTFLLRTPPMLASLRAASSLPCLHRSPREPRAPKLSPSRAGATHAIR